MSEAARDARGVAEPQGDRVAAPLRSGEALPLGEGEGATAVGEGRAGVPLPGPLALGGTEGEALPEAHGEAVPPPLPDADAETEAQCVALREGSTLCEARGEALLLPLGGALEGLSTPLSLGEGVTDASPAEGEAPALTLALPDSDGEPLTRGVALEERELRADAEGEGDGLGEALARALRLVDAQPMGVPLRPPLVVSDGEAPNEKLGRGVAVALAVPDGEGEGAPDALAGLEAPPLRLDDGLTEAEAPLREGEGAPVGVSLTLTDVLCEGESRGEPLPLPRPGVSVAPPPPPRTAVGVPGPAEGLLPSDGDPVGEPLSEGARGEPLGEAQLLPLRAPLREATPLRDAEAPCEVEGGPLREALPLALTPPLPVAVGEDEAVPPAPAPPACAPEALPVGDGGAVPGAGDAVGVPPPP